MNDTQLLPALRPLDIKRVVQDGREWFFLRDPLELSDQQLLTPVEVGPLLMAFDGRHTVEAAVRESASRYGVTVRGDQVTAFAETLSAACLLEDEVSRAAKATAVATYRAAPFRPPALADRVYPAAPAALSSTLQGYERRAGGQQAAAATTADDLVGLISPHIDYHRGHLTYAELWRRAAPAAQEAEVAVIFGTDHSGSAGRLTLTRQSYATPLGVLPSDLGLIDELAACLGEGAAYAEELHHRSEHSVELAAVWLHHMRNGRPLTVIPVLCGHPVEWMRAAAAGRVHPQWTETLAAIDLLREKLAGRQVIAVAAADLAHVGPAFGDPEPFAPDAKARVRAADDALLAACNEGPEAVLAAAGSIEDRYRICGLSPIALTLAFTGAVTAEVTGYDQCPADHDGGDGSIVSIAGVMLRKAR